MFPPFRVARVIPIGIFFFLLLFRFAIVNVVFCMLFPDRAVHSPVDIVSVDRAGQWRRTDSSVVQQST